MYYLRELERADLPIINNWRNNPKLIALLGAPYRYINLDIDTKWYDNYVENRDNTIRCAIVEKGENLILGLVSLVNIDFINRSAELHIMIGDEKNQNKGIGTFAVNAIIQHAFNNMNLQRIELLVLENNERAKHMYEKCGFVYEGCKRNALYKNGDYTSLLQYSILKSEYCVPLFFGGGSSLN